MDCQAGFLGPMAEQRRILRATPPGDPANAGRALVREAEIPGLNYNLGKAIVDKAQMHEGLTFFEQSWQIHSESGSSGGAQCHVNQRCGRQVKG
jgi:hypothetical protein